ncbi:TPA: hypothetical protein SUB30_005621 [Bacillus pseudomycoides]|nr:hypothetical protein [Bacillus pseudomycoides]
MKKIGKVLLSTALLFPVIAPITSHAAENSATTSIQSQEQSKIKSMYGMGNQYTEEQNNEIIDSIKTISPYIKPNTQKQLTLDPKAKEVVSPFVYEHFQKGVNVINESIQKGYTTIDVENNSMQQTELAKNVLAQNQQSANLQNKDGIQYAYTDLYWWGAKWYLSKSEANRWQNEAADSAFYWGAATALAAALAVYFPPAAAVSAASLLISIGSYKFHTMLRDNTSYKGAVVTLDWFYWNVSVSRR